MVFGLARLEKEASGAGKKTTIRTLTGLQAELLAREADVVLQRGVGALGERLDGLLQRRARERRAQRRARAQRQQHYGFGVLMIGGGGETQDRWMMDVQLRVLRVCSHSLLLVSLEAVARRPRGTNRMAASAHAACPPFPACISLPRLYIRALCCVSHVTDSLLGAVMARAQRKRPGSSKSRDAVRGSRSMAARETG